MACPGGCIGGAGQPLLRGNVSKLEKRMKAIHKEDRDKPIRRSYENKSIKKIYNEYLDAPGSKKSTSFASHRIFFKRKNINIVIDKNSLAIAEELFY